MENNKLYFPQQAITPLQQTKNKQHVKSENLENSKKNFSQILDKKLYGNIKFSNHAQERLKSRNIEFSENDMNKLYEAVNKARNKGACDSLVLMNDLALVVSIKNNTVITAVNGQNLKENVFTNIDSAVII